MSQSKESNLEIALQLNFINGTHSLMNRIHTCSENQGFWKEWKTLPTHIFPSIVLSNLMLLIINLSRAAETLRNHGFPSPPDPLCPDFSNFEVALADAVIGIFDLAAHLNTNLPGAILAKHEYNVTHEETR